jgi:DNA mismatch repair protein PMS2
VVIDCPLVRPYVDSCLCRPMPLELPVSEELTILEHMSVFEVNGFRFVSSNDAPAGRRLSLAAVPFSKNTRFGVDDVHELASLLEDHTPGVPRLPRTRAMFASRACRSAIMIGRPLAFDRMRKLVEGMAELEQPWNCPHGRPTLRHLVDLHEVETHS